METKYKKLYEDQLQSNIALKKKIKALEKKLEETECLYRELSKKLNKSTLLVEKVNS